MASAKKTPKSGQDAVKRANEAAHPKKPQNADVLKENASGFTHDEDSAAALALELEADYKHRLEARRGLELSWRMCLNFTAGKQYTETTPRYDIVESEKQFGWQQREVFNHIAPIVETRCAKLGRVRPRMTVRAAGDEESDIYAAKLSAKLLNNCYSGLSLDAVIGSATMWSEVCGTVFYKILWDSRGGMAVGRCADGEIREGEVSLAVVPPFELFPENLGEEDIDRQKSLLHVKAVSLDTVRDTWGVEAEACAVSVYAPAAAGGFEATQPDGYTLVMERYTAPSGEFPEGRLTIAAGSTLLYDGILPYINGEDGKRGYPFVRQCAVCAPGSFFGTGVVERCIPIQRAYNAVKNRKHEFLNRIACGVLAVEDGSTDTALLEDEGLAPGRVIVYRQGSSPPRLLSPGSVPPEFSYEEDRLLQEFKLISGVSDVMRQSGTSGNLTSGVALSILVEQDDTRLSVTAEQIRMAVRDVGRHILRLYRQFADSPRLLRVAGENNAVEQYYFDRKSIRSDDIVFETENELSQSPAQKKSMVLDMLAAGLLSDESGRLSLRMKARIADLLGYSGFENGLDTVNLNVRKAAKEHLKLLTGEVPTLEVDDHALHIAEHAKYMLSGEYESAKKAGKEERFLEHIRKHKVYLHMQETPVTEKPVA